MLAQARDEGLGGEEEDAVRAFAAAESAVGSDDGFASEGVPVETAAQPGNDIGGVDDALRGDEPFEDAGPACPCRRWRRNRAFPANPLSSGISRF